MRQFLGCFSSLSLPWGVMIHGNSGRQSKTASLKVEWGMSCSKSKTSFSVALSPMGPRLRTKWPVGYLEYLGQASAATMILWPRNYWVNIIDFTTRQHKMTERLILITYFIYEGGGRERERGKVVL